MGQTQTLGTPCGADGGGCCDGAVVGQRDRQCAAVGADQAGLKNSGWWQFAPSPNYSQASHITAPGAYPFDPVRCRAVEPDAAPTDQLNARGSGVGVRRICADVRSADAVTPIKGGTRGADIGPFCDVPILPSHHGRGQHGCGDQPSRQDLKSGHFSFSIGYRSQNILASALEISGATGGLN
jgi:hypothetical protein